MEKFVVKFRVPGSKNPKSRKWHNFGDSTSNFMKAANVAGDVRKLFNDRTVQVKVVTLKR